MTDRATDLRSYGFRQDGQDDVTKAEDAFRTISETAELLDLPQHVLRFWETRFSQIKPLKRGGGRRYYRPEDVDLLRGIRHLLYEEGFRIAAVQRILKDQGVRHVAAIGQGSTPPPQPGQLAGDAAPASSSEATFASAPDPFAPAPEAEPDEADLPESLPAGIRAAEDDLPVRFDAGFSEAQKTRLRSTLYELLECKRILDAASRPAVN